MLRKDTLNVLLGNEYKHIKLRSMFILVYHAIT